MKDVKRMLSNGEEVATSIENLVGGHVDIVEGSLQDNYFFANTDEVKLNRFQPRKYIMLLENYENCWSSNHQLIMTDNKELFFDTLKQYQKDFDKVVNA